MNNIREHLRTMADEIESLRAEAIEHYLILDGVVADLRAIADGGYSLMAIDRNKRMEGQQ